MTVEYPSQNKVSGDPEINYTPTAPVVVAGTAVPVAVESPPVVVTGTVVPPTATFAPPTATFFAPPVHTLSATPPSFQISREPSQVNCPFCNKTVVTLTEEEMSGTTWCCVCVLLILCWPCAWVPCVIKSCQDTKHFCPQCRRQIALREAMS